MYIYIYIAQLWQVYCLLTARMELLSQWRQASLGAESQFFSLSGSDLFGIFHGLHWHLGMGQNLLVSFLVG